MSKLSHFVKNIAELGHRRVRKNPRIHPKAKSKLFKIRDPVPEDPVENELLTKWWTDYRLQYNAIKSLFKYELIQHENQIQASSRTDDASDRVRRSNLAEAWNRQTRLQALDKLSELLDQLVNEKNKLIQDYQIDVLEADEKMKDRIEAVLAHSGQFITKENMDEKIEEIMNAEIIDYNFLVNQSGQIVRGSSSDSHVNLLEASQSDESIEPDDSMAQSQTSTTA